MVDEGDSRVGHRMVKDGEVVPAEVFDPGDMVFRDDKLWSAHRRKMVRMLNIFSWISLLTSGLFLAVVFGIYSEPMGIGYCILFALFFLQERWLIWQWGLLDYGLCIYKRGFDIPMIGFWRPQRVFIPLSEVEEWERSWQGIVLRTSFGRKKWVLSAQVLGDEGIQAAEWMLTTRHYVPTTRRFPRFWKKRPKLVVYTEAGRREGGQ